MLEQKNYAEADIQQMQIKIKSLEEQLVRVRTTKTVLEERILILEEEATQSNISLHQTVAEYDQRVAAFNQEWQTYVSQQSTAFEEEKLSLKSQVAALSEELTKTQSLLERMALDQSLPQENGTKVVTQSRATSPVGRPSDSCDMCHSLLMKVQQHQLAIDALHSQIQQYESDRSHSERNDGDDGVSGVFGLMVQQQRLEEVDFGAGDTQEYSHDFSLRYFRYFQTRNFQMIKNKKKLNLEIKLH